jgi:hypothetical protein
MHHDPLDIAIRTLDLVQLVLICQSVYHYLARNWGNQNVLGYSTLELGMHLVPLTGATLLCQGFFLRRSVYVLCVYMATPLTFSLASGNSAKICH